MIDFRKLVEAGVHFGHKMSRWHPKMASYIWGFRDNIHLIDVSKTARELEKAAQFLESVAADGKSIMWVGTKKAAQKSVVDVANRLDYPCVTHRWIGGTLTNYSQVKKSVTKLLHLEDIVKKSEGMHYTKKEFVVMQKAIDRLTKNVGRIANMSWPIGAVVLVDVKKEATALREAVHMDIPVVGLVDTNSDPSLVDYVIPCNDDAPKSINLILDYLAQAAEKGKQKAEKKSEEKKAKQEEAKAAKAESDKPEVKVAEKATKEVKELAKKKVEKKPVEKKEAAPKEAPKKKAVEKK